MTEVVPLRLVKVGGSLFDWPELPARLRDWLTQQSPATTLLVAGGGSLADSIRAADLRFRLGDATAHRLAIGAMRLQAELLRALLPEAKCWAEMTAPPPGCWIADPWALFCAEGSPLAQLPATWDVTSDSLAACCARLFAAQELVLLKSRSGTLAQATCLAELQALAADGLVDPFFPQAAAGVPLVRIVNLRDGLSPEA